MYRGKILFLMFTLVALIFYVAVKLQLIKDANELFMKKIQTIENNKATVIHSSEIADSIFEITQKTYIGIDFGTSTTVVSLAYYDPVNKSIKTKTLSLNQKLADTTIYKSEKIPTMIAWHNNQLLIGEGAKEIRLKKTKDKNIWYSFKMDLGKKNDFLYAQSELSNTRMRLLNGKDATAIFFNYLKQQINKHIKDNNYPLDVEYSISIPASFEPNQRKDMIEALELNGYKFNEQAFIDEPNAAFLSYISDSELQKNVFLSEEYNANILVFDYGAGTCDVSILEVGLENDRFSSCNVSISKFDHIGGKEIDRLIAIDVLLPQLLEENGLDSNYFTTTELRRFILPKLERFAELLKIEACKTINLAFDKIDLNEYKETYSIASSVEFKTRKGTYRIETPKITFDEFYEIVSIFTSLSESGTYRINRNERFLSVFKPVKSAIKKAKLTKNDIDYVLFIGGSAKNPLIRKAIKDYFTNSECLLPRDLQLHVSAGAAINSLLYNAFNEKVISPITSEPLYLLIQGEFEEELYPLLPAGSSLPSDKIIINELSARKGSDRIELPICLTDKSNILYNIVMDGVYSVCEKIELSIYIDANRTINCSMIVGGNHKSISIENSLLSVSSKDENIEKAEYEYSKSLSQLNGEVSSEELERLYDSYQKYGEHLKSAEIAEELHKKYNKVTLNNIGLAYDRGGDSEKAIYYYTQATLEEPSASSFFNLARAYEFLDEEKYIENLKKALSIDPEHGLSQYSLIRYEINSGIGNVGNKKLKKLYLKWSEQYKNDFFPYHHSWLISCAKLSGEYEFAKKVEKECNKDTKQGSNRYSKENLAMINREELSDV